MDINQVAKWWLSGYLFGGEDRRDCEHDTEYTERELYDLVDCLADYIRANCGEVSG
jgi:hypothetical protein